MKREWREMKERGQSKSKEEEEMEENESHNAYCQGPVLW